MDRAMAKVMRQKLESIFKDNGIDGFEIHVGNASYNDVQVTFKVEVRESGAGSAEELALDRFAGFYQLDTSKVYKDRSGDSFSLVGYKSRARKNPWIVQKLGIGGDAPKYVISDDTAKRWFGKATLADTPLQQELIR